MRTMTCDSAKQSIVTLLFIRRYLRLFVNSYAPVGYAFSVERINAFVLLALNLECKHACTSTQLHITLSHSFAPTRQSPKRKASC